MQKPQARKFLSMVGMTESFDMKNYGLLFDCDGTLIDSLGPVFDSFNYAIQSINEKPRDPEEIKSYFGAGGDRILINLLGDEQKGLAAFEYYIEHQTQLTAKMKLHDGILALLETASAAGVPMGVVTGRHARDMEVALRPHKVHDYFKVMIADSHVPRSKPAPDGILLAIETLGLEPKNVCYVGDSPMDMQAARDAGCTLIAALWDSLAKVDLLKAENPQLMAKTPAEVWKYFLHFAQGAAFQ